MADLVTFKTQGHVAIFTLNRPRAYNAISAELAEEFEAHMRTFEANEDLWIGVVTSSQNKASKPLAFVACCRLPPRCAHFILLMFSRLPI